MSSQFKPFNESSFALALSCELIEWARNTGSLQAHPTIPTLQDEADLGFDIKIPTNWKILFLQFKVPTYLHGHNAAQWGHFSAPYYRFKVKTNPTRNGKIQHNTLCDLEISEKDDALVFYSAPIYTRGTELYHAIMGNSVQSKSIFVHPSILPPVAANSRHVIAYTGSHDITAFSSPSESRIGNAETFKREIEAAVRKDPHDKETGAQFIERMAARTRKFLPDINIESYEEAVKTRSKNKVFPGKPSPLEVKMFDPERFEEEYARKDWSPHSDSDTPNDRSATRRNKGHIGRSSTKPRVVSPFQAILELGKASGAIPFLLSN